MAKPTGRSGSSRHRPGIRSGIAFLVYVFNRFNQDHCKERAASLTFTSLLALVPLLAISFAIFAAFPAFQNMKGDLQSFVFQNFVPEIGSVVYDHIEAFTQKTGQMTAFGVVFLAVTSVLLLSSVNSTFNAIWRVGQARGLISRLLVYWAVLTLSPVLFGASLSLSSYLFAAAQASGVEDITGPLSRLAAFVPLILQIVGFSILYLVMPYFPVRRMDAFFGGFAAGVMFELLKKGFGFYIQNFPTYETLYGALSVFPILLVWIYVAWGVVLLGAEMTAAMPEWRAGVRTIQRSTVPAARLLSAALAILHALLVTSARGRGLNSRNMARAAPAAPEAVTAARQKLQAARYIARNDQGEWLLARDLDTATLNDLRRDFELDLDITDLRYIPKRGWGRRYGEIISKLSEADREIAGMSLKTLLAPESEAEIIEFPDQDEDEDGGDNITDRKTKLLAMLGLTTIGSP
ncbi:MAG: YihY family inner membrane protein [Alphaproteobacteria bacterium]|nr:YihY family inner membrane protein [Alphaproteobacteria bacterium]